MFRPRLIGIARSVRLRSAPASAVASFPPCRCALSIVPPTSSQQLRQQPSAARVRVRTTERPRTDPLKVDHAATVRAAIDNNEADLAWRAYASPKRGGLTYADFRDLAELLEASTVVGRRRQEAAAPSAAAATTITTSLLRQRMAEMEEVLSDAREAGELREVDIHNALLSTYVRTMGADADGETDGQTVGELLRHVDRLWDDIQRSEDLEPNTATCCTIIGAYSKHARSPERIGRFYDALIDRGYPIDSQVFAALVTGSIVADRSCGEATAMDYLSKMETLLPQREEPLTAHPYNRMIAHYTGARKPQQPDMKAALTIYDRMIRNDVSPDTSTFNALIDGHMKVGDVDEALRVFRVEMQGRFLVPVDVVTLNVLIGGHMRAAGVAHAAGDRTVANDQIRSARDWYTFMLRERMNPTAVTFNVLIQGFGAVGMMHEMTATVREMQTFGTVPTSATFQVLAQVYADHKDFKGVQITWKDMIQTGMRPAVRTCAVFIKAAIACGRSDNFLRFCKGLAKEQGPTGMKVYERLEKQALLLMLSSGRFLQKTRDGFGRDTDGTVKAKGQTRGTRIEGGETRVWVTERRRRI